MASWFEIKNGKFKWLANEKENFIIEAENLKDGIYYSEIKKVDHMKTLQQLRYFHGVVCKVTADEIGETPENLKRIWKIKFLEIPIEELIIRLSENFVGNEKEKFKYIEMLERLDFPPVTRSLASLPEKTMSEFIDNCIRDAYESYNVVIPAIIELPNKFQGVEK